MSYFLLFFAAASAGIAATFLAYLLLNAAVRAFEQSAADDAAGANGETRKLPILFLLLGLFAWAFRSLAGHAVFAASREALNKSIRMAGLTDRFDGREFLAIRFSAMFLGAVLLVIAVAAGRPIYGLIFLLLLAAYPGVWLKGTIQRRHKSILRALPNVLDLLTLSVEAGKDFVSSLRDILSRRRLDPLGEELHTVFSEIQFGRTRAEALNAMASAVNLPELTGVLHAIVQSEELGVSIGQLLRIQGDMLRDKRFSEAERLANEAPVKIILPIVLFVLPAVLVVLAGPIFLMASRML
ncbi:MAG: type II secretion system F family protein [Victivallaceae bacterium]|nr:type II secretion system F family protein [Victivallaceae bacterium]